ncbi:MAG: GAP family protein [Actinomycetes bacterium]
MVGPYVAVLPLAVGAAVSPGLLTIELLILSSKIRPKARAWFYLLGVVAVLVGFTFVALTDLRELVESTGAPPKAWSIAARLLVALLLVAFGIRQLIPLRAPGEVRQSRVATRLEASRPPTFFVLGVLTMLTNWSSLLLYMTAVKVIDGSEDGTSVKVLVGTLLLVITIAPLLLPVLAVTVVGHRSDALLARVGEFTSRYTRQINAGICFFFAVLIAGSAIKELTG